MRNICVFTNTLMKGGAEKQAVLLCKALSDKYHVILLVYYGHLIHNDYLNMLKECKIELIKLNGSHFLKFIRLFFLIRRKKTEIIFSYLLTTNLIGGIVAKIAGVKFTIGGIRSSKIDKKKLKIQRFLHNYINNITIYNNNQGILKLRQLGFKKSKSVLIPNCFELKIDPIVHNTAYRVNILSVGRFHEAKDYTTAIEAIVKLHEQYSEIEYTIIGYGSLEQSIRNLINEKKADQYIKLIIDPENIDVYYEKSDIYLLTSLYEGLSNTILEAMSFSLPIVATNVGDNNLLVKDNLNGYLSLPKDIKGIYDSLFLLCKSQEERLRLGKNSYQFLKDQYSYEKFQNRYFDFIEKLDNC